MIIVSVTLHLMYNFSPQKSLTKHSRRNIGAEGGPPPFVPFGQVRTRSASFIVTFDLLALDEVDLTLDGCMVYRLSVEMCS